MKIYIFRTVPLSIIRSLSTVHSAMVYVMQVCRQLSSRTILVLLESCNKLFAFYQKLVHFISPVSCA